MNATLHSTAISYKTRSKTKPSLLPYRDLCHAYIQNSFSQCPYRLPQSAAHLKRIRHPPTYQPTLWCWGIFNKIDFKFVWTYAIFRPFRKVVIMWRVHMINFVYLNMEWKSLVRVIISSKMCEHMKLKASKANWMRLLMSFVPSWIYAFEWCVFK